MRTVAHVRRASLVVATWALAGAAGFIVPSGASATPSRGEPPAVPGVEAESVALDARGPGWSTRIDPERAEMVVISWERDSTVELELRSRAVGTPLSGWVHLHPGEDEGPDPDAAEGAGNDRTIVGPVWIGRDASLADLRVVAGDPEDLRIELLDTTVALPRPRSATARITSLTAAAVPNGAPTFIRPRRAWATAGWAYQNEGCGNGPSMASELSVAIVHHTVSTNAYSAADVPSMLRGIYYAHTNVNGWCDVGYNFVVDRFGGVWETRSGGANLPIIGGHAQGFNTASVGIAFLGQHQPGASPPAAGPSEAALRSLVQVISWKFDIHGIDPRTGVQITSRGSTRYPAGTVVSLPRIIGHRDVGLTSCPGDLLRDRLPGVWSEVVAATGSPAEFGFGFGSDLALLGDWNRDGIDTPGVFRRGLLFGQFHLTNRNASGPAAGVFEFGFADDIPLVGDWNGDGIDTIGVFRRGGPYGRFFLRNANTGGPVDVQFEFGFGSDVPVVGDWNGDGIDTIGVRRGNVLYLRDSNSSGPVSMSYAYGNATDIPLPGDFDGDRIDTFALRRGTTIFVSNLHWTGLAQGKWTAGATGQQPVAGTADAGRPDTVGLARANGGFLRFDVVAEQPRR